MTIKDSATSNRKYTRRSIQAYLVGRKELPWILGVIRASAVPLAEVHTMMQVLRTYGSRERWDALSPALQPQA
jgi:hypothetical protein